MGQEHKKYHVTDSGEVFRINDDGSFTKMGIVSEPKNESHSKTYRHKHSKDSKKESVGWFKTDYNWLFVFGIVAIIGYGIATCSCGWPISYHYHPGQEIAPVCYYADNTSEILTNMVIILILYGLDGIWGYKLSSILAKIIRAILILYICWYMFLLPGRLCEEDFIGLLSFISLIPSLIWIALYCLRFNLSFNKSSKSNKYGTRK